MVDISAAQKLSSPNPFALITSKGERGTNIMALSWWTYCCNHPATVAICIGKRSYSGRCIDQTGQFCLCLPGADIAEAAFRCGTCSGVSCEPSIFKFLYTHSFFSKWFMKDFTSLEKGILLDNMTIFFLISLIMMSPSFFSLHAYLFILS